VSSWHREHPELTGTDADPWMMHASYRDAMTYVKRLAGIYCRHCETLLGPNETHVCVDCAGDSLTCPNCGAVFSASIPQCKVCGEPS
jgi:methionyl-tRNA synthetase